MNAARRTLCGAFGQDRCGSRKEAFFSAALLPVQGHRPRKRRSSYFSGLLDADWKPVGSALSVKAPLDRKKVDLDVMINVGIVGQRAGVNPTLNITVVGDESSFKSSGTVAI